ncbi:hypothetical protein [Desulfobulbus elongatus]|uniref:hypothetical protein n=1 Tax=Desulfobulbus elongatus TaxID=53332 RepID=UPI0006880195|nr:hypothetical protein [Desulfobulbus elongatus]
MKIAAATVSMDAAHTYKEVEQRFTGVRMGAATAVSPEQADSFGIRLATMLASSTRTTLSCRSEVDRTDGGGTLCFAADGWSSGTEATLARLTGQVVGQPVRIGASGPDAVLGPPARSAGPFYTLQSATLISGMMYSQEESLLFSAQGTVRTTDGREIAFDLGLAMERSTMVATAAAMEVSTLFIDPLILQFDVDAPLLGDSTFLFDLDSDGTREQLACPGGGCGFLAFDRNQDGRINNGLELFGPASGSGFGELADLDSDANLWIDENDPVFDQLLIWSPDGQGGGSLLSLREAGVGAIAVTHAGTGFQLERADGSVMGTVTASGIFLTESGEVRPLQEVDLALPGTQAQSAPNPAGAEESGGEELESALHDLREIITLQRLRLRMMLTGERLRSMAANREEQRQTLLDWLQNRSEWYARVEDGLRRDGASGAVFPDRAGRVRSCRSFPGGGFVRG